MKVTAEKNEKVGSMVFASIYPLYLNRLEKNGRTKEELDQVIESFTGFDQEALQAFINEKATFQTFFQKAKIHPSGLSVSLRPIQSLYLIDGAQICY